MILGAPVSTERCFFLNVIKGHNSLITLRHRRWNDPGAPINLAFYIVQKFHDPMFEAPDEYTTQMSQYKIPYSQDSDQPPRPHSLVRVLILRLMKRWTIDYP